MTYDAARADRLAHFLLKKVNAAVRDYNMIAPGDRIAIALSGGKDSFCLLRILQYRLRFARDKYEIAAVHVVGDARGPDMPRYTELESWLEQNGIEYLVRPTHIAHDEQLPMGCQRCTWNRRKTLFEMANDLGCNKLAFGHHLDDLAETALLNQIHHARNETMTPVARYFDGEMAIIRPLIYVPEREVKRFSAAHSFPIPPSECPRGMHTQRRRMKDLIAEMHIDCRQVTRNLARSALNAMNVDPL